ncbi:MAG: helix-turn-helix domain-containing protein [Phocaeicola sp.]
MERQIIRIGDTPLSFSVYSVESSPTHKNSPGTVEIIFCLKGTVRFGYAYEDFTLNAGDYIAVDRDAYFLYKGRDNVCVSFYLDMLHYEDKYPYVRHALYVCEGTDETDVPDYPRPSHIKLKSLMIAALKCAVEGKNEELIHNIADKMAELFVNNFDIAFYHYGSESMPRKTLERNRYITAYLNEHLHEKISMKTLADEMGITEGYLSEFMRKSSIGFRNILSYVRANESEEYLLNTDKTIMETSELCGFSDVKYYYSAFKRWYKCTPKQFRERYAKITDADIEYLPRESIEGLINQLLQNHFIETNAT